MTTSDSGDSGIVEIALGQESEAVEDQSLVELSVRPPWLWLVMAAAVLGLALWQMSAGSDDGLDSERDVDAADIGPETTPPTTTLRQVTTTTQGLLEAGDEEQGLVIETTLDDQAEAQSQFPLFPATPGLTLAIRTKEGVSLLNADTGQVAVHKSEHDIRNSAGLGVFGPRNQSLAGLGGTLIVHSDAGLLLFPVFPGVGAEAINLGSAIQVDAQDDRIVLVSASGAENFLYTQLDERGEVVVEPIEVAADRLWLLPGKFKSARVGGVYELTLDGFRRVSKDTLTADGPNHVLVLRCDERLKCDHYLLDIDLGQETLVDLPDRLQLAIKPSTASISPDGRYLEHSDPNFARRMLFEFATGEDIDLGPVPSPNGRPPEMVRWTPDSSYLVETFVDDLIIIEVATGEVTTIDLTTIGIAEPRRSLAILQAP